MIAGIDLGSRRIDLAAIPLSPEHPNPVVTWRSWELPPRTASEDAIFTRIRGVCNEIGKLDVMVVYVERPPVQVRGGTNAQTLLLLNQVYGAVMAGLPIRIARDSLYPVSWRALIRKLNGGERVPPGKRGSIVTAAAWIAAEHANPPHRLDDHAADALLLALAGRRVCWEAAA